MHLRARCTHTQLTHTRDGINNGRVSCLWRNSICHLHIPVQSNISWNFFGNCTSRKLKIYVNWLQNTWALSNNYLVIYQQTAHRLNNLSSMIYNTRAFTLSVSLRLCLWWRCVCLSHSLLITSSYIWFVDSSAQYICACKSTWQYWQITHPPEKYLAGNLNSNWSDINLNWVYLFMRHKNHSIEFDWELLKCDQCIKLNRIKSNQIKSSRNESTKQIHTHCQFVQTTVNSGHWYFNIIHWINSQDRKYQLFHWFRCSIPFWNRCRAILVENDWYHFLFFFFGVWIMKILPQPIYRA